MRYVSAILALVAWNVICFTGKTTAAKFNRTQIEKKRALNWVARSANQFSFDQFQRLFHNVSGNVVFASCESFISLSMAPYGSQRNALQELRTNDPLPADPVDRQLGLEALVEKIDSYKSPNFDWAKKVFHRVDSETGAELRVAMKDHYLHAESQGLDFNNSTEASGVIDEWVETTTRDRTSNLVKSDDLTADVSAVLVNAVYFKGVWFRPFTPTGDDVFHVNSSKQIKIPFMRKLDFFEYGELPRVDAEFIRIPYEINGSENEISMFIILPKLVDGIAELERKIKKVKIAQLLRGKLQEILLSMPKFTIKNEISIDEPLKNAQFIDMFTSVTGRSQASNVSSQRLSKFVQKVVIEVDEKSGFRGINASPLPGTPKLSINHPFIFIVATTSGIPVILFTARYTGSDYENGEFSLEKYRTRCIKDQG